MSSHGRKSGNSTKSGVLDKYLISQLALAAAIFLTVFTDKIYQTLGMGRYTLPPDSILSRYLGTDTIYVTAPVYQEILEHFMLPSADKLYGDADIIFQQDLAPAHTAKGTKSWFNDHGVTVLDWPANSLDLNPTENLWGIVKRKMRDTRPNNADDLKATVKETWASIPPQQCHKLITSMPRRIEAVIKAKGAPTKY